MRLLVIAYAIAPGSQSYVRANASAHTHICDARGASIKNAIPANCGVSGSDMLDIGDG